MKQCIFVLLICFFGFSYQVTQAQTHLKGQRFLQVTPWLMDSPVRLLGNPLNRLGLSIQTGRYRQELQAWTVGASYGTRTYGTSLIGDSTSVRLEQLALTYGHQFNLARSANRLFFVRGVVGAMGGYELVNRNRYRLGDTYGLLARSRFLLGIDAGVELEFYGLVLGITQRWCPTSVASDFHTFYQAGYRFHF